MGCSSTLTQGHHRSRWLTSRVQVQHISNTVQRSVAAGLRRPTVGCASCFCGVRIMPVGLHHVVAAAVLCASAWAAVHAPHAPAKASVGILRLNTTDNTPHTDNPLPFFKFLNTGNEGGAGFAIPPDLTTTPGGRRIKPSIPHVVTSARQWSRSAAVQQLSSRDQPTLITRGHTHPTLNRLFVCLFV
jgi:hypothetical protein